MPLPYVLALAGSVVALVVIRAVVRWRPAARLARRMPPLDLALTIVGTVGLVFHCGAMFSRSVVLALPGTGPAVRTINDMGGASVALFVIPAALLLIGLRRQYPVAVAIVAATLIAVGITMYDQGPLTAHLVAIFVSVMTLAVVATQFVRPKGFEPPTF